ncbi:Aste57867_22153 [Aphanomyces stellatus]|uniref:Aste57867_22153 protein n=1 Tax=Aphanomyces stellatus TaxID=120398 RepID=A0A485LKU1_9STRA|nr:hypothetical protein As57867_022084 [Aphanomyces stellatus]VFT98820.1 Aste57867_22153 [Aphanomyces stellatus]
MEGNQGYDDVAQESIQEAICDAPNGEHLQQPALELQLVTGNRSAPAAKHALSLSPRGAMPLFTSNSYILLQEDDVELSIEDHVVPRLVLEDPEHPRVIVQTKKKQRNEAKKAHLDRAKKFIADKTAEQSIVERQAILQLEPAVVTIPCFPAWTTLHF